MTVKREFQEEAGAIEDPRQRAAFERDVEQLFANGKQVYRGYVDGEAAPPTPAPPRSLPPSLAISHAYLPRHPHHSPRHLPPSPLADPRATDNAWMETTAFHFHCNSELGSRLPLHAGDDAGAVKWLDVAADQQDYRNLYASHKTWVDKVAAGLNAEQ